jgi:4-amino-4-deoxy-L-arabinose transferase-like glycosyltransferase
LTSTIARALPGLFRGSKIHGGAPVRTNTKPPSVAESSPKHNLPSSSLTLHAIVAGVLALAAFLRFYQLPTVPHGVQVDEAMNGCNILQILETGKFQFFYPENMGREGLFINLQVLASYWLGNEPWVLRAVSAGFGVLTVWSTYLLVQELLSPFTALFASFFVATSFWHLMLSRLGTRAISAPFFFTVSLFLLIRACRAMRKEHASPWRMTAAGLVYGAGFHTYTAYRVSPLVFGPVLLYFFMAARREGWLQRFRQGCIAFCGTVFVVLLPLVTYFLQHPAAATGRASQVMVFERSANPLLEIATNIWRTAQMFFFEGDHNWRHNYNSRAELFWPVGILFAFGIGIAIDTIVRAIRRRETSRHLLIYVLLLAWMVAASLPAILSGEGVPHALRSSLMIPAVFALAGVGAERAWSWSRESLPPMARISVLAAFILLVAYDPYSTYFERWASSSEIAGHFSKSLVDLADQYNRMPANTPRYIAVTSTGPSANGIPVLLMPFTYLTRSYTEKQQQETNIRYLTPQNLRLPPGTNIAGKTFCQVAQEVLRGAPVTCLNLRY